jgi:hypothetical protein
MGGLDFGAVWVLGGFFVLRSLGGCIDLFLRVSGYVNVHDLMRVPCDRSMWIILTGCLRE